jgi:hypothetical protein
LLCCPQQRRGVAVAGLLLLDRSEHLAACGRCCLRWRLLARSGRRVRLHAPSVASETIHPGRVVGVSWASSSAADRRLSSVRSGAVRSLRRRVCGVAWLTVLLQRAPASPVGSTAQMFSRAVSAVSQSTCPAAHCRSDRAARSRCLRGREQRGGLR